MVCIAFKFANYAKLRTKKTHLSRKFSWLFCSRWKAANFCHPGPLKNDNPKSFHPISKTKNYLVLQLPYMGHIKVWSCTWVWTWVLHDIWFMISLTLYVWWRWCQHRALGNIHKSHCSSFQELLKGKVIYFALSQQKRRGGRGKNNFLKDEVKYNSLRPRSVNMRGQRSSLFPIYRNS